LNCGVGLNAPRHFFYDANFWDCLAHLSVERPPGRRLVAPCGMALVMRYSRICERSSPSSRRLIALHRCTGSGSLPGRDIGGIISTPLPTQAWPGRMINRQARLNPTRRPSMSCQGGLGRPSVGLSGPCVSSHRTRVRKASQRFVSLKAFSTEETNQRFRQRSAKVPNSNQWIIIQPTPCLLRLRASKGVLSRENVNSSAVSGNTMRGAARISGLGREFDQRRQGERREIPDQQTEPLATG
jgi:hypothetical protein